MNDLTIKEKILMSLLEFPKTTGNIALELGYFNEKTKYPRYNVIKSDLNTLESYGFIHRIPSNQKSPGAPAKTYNIVYKIPILRKILEKYPSLISYFQKNNVISNMLLKEHQWLFNPNMLREAIINFKLFLNFSPTFFKICLMSSSGELLKVIINLNCHLKLDFTNYHMYDEEYINLVTKPLKLEPNKPPLVVNRFDFGDGPLYILFHSCILTDNLYKKDDDGVKYVIEDMNKIDKALIKIQNENDGTKYIFFEDDNCWFEDIDKVIDKVIAKIDNKINDEIV